MILAETDGSAARVAVADQPLGCSGGSIHIEFPGRAAVTIEAGVDAALASAVIERLAR